MFVSVPCFHYVTVHSFHSWEDTFNVFKAYIGYYSVYLRSGSQVFTVDTWTFMRNTLICIPKGCCNPVRQSLTSEGVTYMCNVCYTYIPGRSGQWFVITVCADLTPCMTHYCPIAVCNSSDISSETFVSHLPHYALPRHRGDLSDL